MNLRPYGSTSVLILAGGRGERLDLLTRLRAKPAVPFGGGFRIIDFVLSNCFHAGLGEVYIITQYLPRSLEDHVGFGRAWDLDRLSAGLNYLHPFRGLERSNWYGGTANALYENLAYLEESTADHFLILGGDHIYRMDYRDLLARHEQSMAQVTVGVRPVPLDQAHHFGIFEPDERGQARSFEEKPEAPRSNLASMGIYAVRRQFLLEALRERGPEEPTLDFGRDLVPQWVSQGVLGLYHFDGYWLDVGTLDSYFRAHRDLLGDEPVFPLDAEEWPILSRTPPWAPLHLADTARVGDSLVCEGCRVRGSVTGSVLGPGVLVEEGAEVVDAIVMENAVVGAGSRVERSILDKRAVVGAGCRVGGAGAGEPNAERPQHLNSGLTLLGKDSRVPAGMVLGRNVRWSVTREEDLAGRFADGVVPDGSSILS